MSVSKAELTTLSTFIIEEIKKNFERRKLSGNLVNSIRVVETEKGYNIEIPAEIYDMERYFRDKVIVPTGQGSYASQLNDSGSKATIYYGPNYSRRKYIKPGNHKGFIDEAIQTGLERWKMTYTNKYSVKSVKEE